MEFVKANLFPKSNFMQNDVIFGVYHSFKGKGRATKRNLDYTLKYFEKPSLF